MRRPWSRSGQVPPGVKGIDVVNTEAVEHVPEPGGLPPVAAVAAVDGSFTVKIWVREWGDGEQFIHPDTVMDMLRGMMRGPAAPMFCDQFELALRRVLAEAKTNGRRIQGLPKQTEAASVGGMEETG